MKKNTQLLSISKLSVSIEEKNILENVDLAVLPGEIHVIMGPNGSGKSTLTYALLGHPAYTITSGKITVDGKNVTDFEPHDRAKAGLQLAFQNPIAVAGVGVSHFLKTAYVALNPQEKFNPITFTKELKATCEQLSLPQEFLKRSLHEGFSGGEKKKLEMLQLLTLKPKYALFDEIDTGLDVDALKIVAGSIDSLQKRGVGIIIITHYNRILSYLNPTHVHILRHGQMIKHGGTELINYIETHGYTNI